MYVQDSRGISRLTHGSIITLEKLISSQALAVIQRTQIRHPPESNTPLRTNDLD